jgi:hypothetical protein
MPEHLRPPSPPPHTHTHTRARAASCKLCYTRPWRCACWTPQRAPCVGGWLRQTLSGKCGPCALEKPLMSSRRSVAVSHMPLPSLPSIHTPPACVKRAHRASPANEPALKRASTAWGAAAACVCAWRSAPLHTHHVQGRDCCRMFHSRQPEPTPCTAIVAALQLPAHLLPRPKRHLLHQHVLSR